MILAQTERIKIQEKKQKTIPRQDIKDRNNAVEYEVSDEEQINPPKNPPMPDFIARRSVPSLAFISSQVISQEHEFYEDFAFMKDIISLDECPEWTGYNTKKAREAGVAIGRKAKAIYVPLINKTPACPTTIKAPVISGT